MPDSLRRVDLRLTIPAYAPYGDLARELVEKFAEYAGVSDERRADIAARMLQTMTRAGEEHASLDITLAAEDGEIDLTAVPVHPERQSD
jgi:hypothetical protein